MAATTRSTASSPPPRRSGAALLGLSEEDEAEWEEEGRLRRVLVVKTEWGALAEA